MAEGQGVPELVLNLIYSQDGSITSMGVPVEIVRSQINSISLSRIFDLNPATVWIQQHHGRKVYFPDMGTSEFDFSNDLEDRDYLVVRSQKAQSRETNLSVDIPGPSSSNSVPAVTPSRPIITAKKTNDCATVKIIQASMKRLSTGKAEFAHQAQTFIDIRDDTANVTYPTSMVHRKWGNDYVIVTTDGLPIEDCSGTKGLRFWKVGSRKLYAVKKDQSLRKRASMPLDEESDDEDFIHVTRSKHPKQCNSTILKELKVLKKDIYKIICMEAPPKPPIAFSSCCKRILGCKSCVDMWYTSGSSQQNPAHCPHCRSTESREPMLIKGLDDFLRCVATFISPDNEQVIRVE
uniref:RING-type domain-containing protein n=1 Tax=Amphimedon queenslandica TaxID=400682 RepID=A0A1X7UYK0_AMPQE